MSDQSKNLGLVLTSGGARGAYQAGAILALAEITKAKTLPFPILSGVSAGSINAFYLANFAQDFQRASQKLSEIWTKLTPNQVFQTDGLTLTKTGLALVANLGISGLGQNHVQSLLVTDPLKVFLDSIYSLEGYRKNLSDGHVLGLAITATNYNSGGAVTFFEGKDSIIPWFRSTRVSMRTKINTDHILASSAIPIFFPPAIIDGTYYGDGAVRMNTPLSPAIHMGAEKIIAIGVRKPRPLQSRLPDPSYVKDHSPYIAEVVSVLMNAMFLDALEADIERTERINLTLSMMSEADRVKHPAQLRSVPVLALRPSEDLGLLAADVFQKLPFSVRHFLKGIGVTSDSGYDLLSYLSFDSEYTSKLTELGYQDTLNRKVEIEKFLE